MIYEVEVNGRLRRVELKREGTGYRVAVDGRTQHVDARQQGGIWSLLVSDADEAVAGTSRTQHSYEIAIAEEPSGGLAVQINGRVVRASVSSARGSWARRSGHDTAAGGSGPYRILAPMPGKVVKLLVAPGDRVDAGHGVIVVEAMKMENELRTVRAGTVQEVRVTQGSSVEAGAVLVIIE